MAPCFFGYSMVYLYHQVRVDPQKEATMWCVCDEFGFAWGDVVETLEEARRQLEELRAEARKKGWDWGFEIEKRG